MGQRLSICQIRESKPSQVKGAAHSLGRTQGALNHDSHISLHSNFLTFLYILHRS